MAGIYIHIPVCRTRCGYCDFYSEARADLLSALPGALCRELLTQKSYLGRQKVSTLYFGGGTPSLLSPAETGAVIENVRANYDCSQLEEVTLEANPDDITSSFLTGIMSAGVNRLSLGVQSFIDRDLRLMNRRHDAAKATRAFHMARQAGFRNITIDLIYGIPGMTDMEWKSNLRLALDLAPEHISAYHLTIEENTRFGSLYSSGKLSEVPEKQSEEQYLLLHDLLVNGGYEHYEISNFALPGFRSKHNSAYWSGEHYLGIGPSAHSYNGEQRRYVKPDIHAYLESSGAPLYETETLSPRDKYNEFVMVSLRCAGGVDISLLEMLFGSDMAEFFRERARGFVRQGMLVSKGQGYMIPPAKYLLADRVISGLFLVD